MLGYEYRVVTCLIVFPVHLQAGKGNLGLTGVYIGTKRFSGVISNQRNRIFWRLFDTKQNFFQTKRSFFILVTPGTSIGASILWFWASSESNCKIAKRFSADQHIPKKPNFLKFLAQNEFFFVEMPFLLLQHLANLSERLSCDFEHHCSLTVKFRSV